MKMDIERGEYEALPGAEELLEGQATGCIFLEMAEWAAKRSGHSTYAIKRLLVDAGCRVFKLGSSGLISMEMDTAAQSENAIAFSGRAGHRQVRASSEAMEARPWQLP